MEITDKVYRVVYRELEFKKKMSARAYEFFLCNMLSRAGILRTHLKEEEGMLTYARRMIDKEVGVRYLQGVDDIYVVLEDKSPINFDDPKFG